MLFLSIWFKRRKMYVHIFIYLKIAGIVLVPSKFTLHPSSVLPLNHSLLFLIHLWHYWTLDVIGRVYGFQKPQLAVSLGWHPPILPSLVYSFARTNMAISIQEQGLAQIIYIHIIQNHHHKTSYIYMFTKLAKTDQNQNKEVKLDQADPSATLWIQSKLSYSSSIPFLHEWQGVNLITKFVMQDQFTFNILIKLSNIL